MPVTKTCEYCGAPVTRPSARSFRHPHVYCNRTCTSQAHRRNHHPQWKGGRSINSSGYVIVLTETGQYRQEHRIVMEQMLGRPLTSEELVHHKDGNKLNNAPENLELFPSNSAHATHHQGGQPIRTCSVCGRKHFAKGLCKICYNARRWSQTKDSYPEEWEHRGGGCAACHEIARPHYAHNLCHPCYDRWRRQQVKSQS